MDRDSPYYRQVALLVQVLPTIARERAFALKGGTAINLFVRNFPRLSVDIDLTYLPLAPRDEALGDVRRTLERIAEALDAAPGLAAVVQANKPDEMRIIVDSRGAQIKVEVSPVARGTLHPPTEREVVETVEDEFGFASIQVVSLADLYGGKLCAALDRQHPRDLFDIKVLLDDQGIDRELFDGFLTYLLSHPRPIAEVLAPRWQDIGGAFEAEFRGMTRVPVSLEQLLSARERMLQRLKAHLTQRDVDFLLGFKRGRPDWSLAPSEQLEYLPAIQWKLMNVGKMGRDKRQRAADRLEETLMTWLGEGAA